jgi:hypothetical protein
VIWIASHYYRTRSRLHTEFDENHVAGMHERLHAVPRDLERDVPATWYIWWQRDRPVAFHVAQVTSDPGGDRKLRHDGLVAPFCLRQKLRVSSACFSYSPHRWWVEDLTDTKATRVKSGQNALPQ